MHKAWKQVLRRGGSALLALLLLISAAGIVPAARAADAGGTTIVDGGDGTYMVDNGDGTYNVTFQYAGDAKGTIVQLRGEIKGADGSEILSWGGAEMEPGSNGVWTKTLENIPIGQYEYKFYTDDWTYDTSKNNNGNNNILKVPQGVTVNGNSVTFFCYGQTTDGVKIRGEMSGDDWGTEYQLADDDNDGIYTWTMTLEPGSYKYKFIDNNWEKGDDRSFVVPESTPGPGPEQPEKPDYDSPVVEGNTVTFNYYEPDPEVKSVEVRGDMNNWGNEGVEPLSLTKGENGVWTGTTEIPAGTYGYKFVDSKGWHADPKNPKTMPDSDNSKLVVPGLVGDSITVLVGEDGADLPELTLLAADGTETKVKPTYTLPDGLSGVEIKNEKVIVADSYEGEGFEMTAKHNDLTATVKVTVTRTPPIKEVTVEGNTVTFRYKGTSTTTKVYLAGTMNGWKTDVDKLEKDNDGIWTLTKTLAAGSYQYKFVIDSNWEGGDNKTFAVSGLVGASVNKVLEDGANTFDLPEKLTLIDEEGNESEVTPAYTLPNAPAGITLAGSTITVEEAYSGDPFEVTATYNALTAKVTVTVTRISADDVVVKLHYHRNDNNYDGWNAWIWVDDGPNYSGDFTETDEHGGKVITILNPAAPKLGFIIRKGDWEEKDVDADQFIYVAEVVSGTVHIYVESKVNGYTKEYGEGADIQHTVINAIYNEENATVSVLMSAEIDGLNKENFQINDGAIAISSMTGAASEWDTYTYTLKLAAPLELGEEYKLEYNGKEVKIQMPSLYDSKTFEDDYTYKGNDLGATWTAEKTTFRVWAPTATSVNVKLYTSGRDGADDLIKTLPMTKDVKGTWVVEEADDLNGTYYTYEAVVGGKTVETVDPYARTTGVNGVRAMVIDLASTNPTGWDSDTNPNADLGYTDAVIYELHVRDLSSDASSGITSKNKGKFLGLTEHGTKTSGGNATGIDHIKELGVTHIHLLPVYDFGPGTGHVDEENYNPDAYNWGYDPVNYNVPEGSYATDAVNGAVRVKEMKQMVKSLHDDGISVIMDVVYNHVADAETFSVNVLVPEYFSRVKPDGTYSNNSGCGNDTASERSMVRKYIVDSVNYWADEYHIDGFRFDLVGLLDTETINEIVTTVHEKHPDVIFYGEGWDMSNYQTKDNVTMATQGNSTKTPGFAYFSDNIRDAIKGNGSGSSSAEPGYVSGAANKAGDIVNNFMARPWWSNNPTQIVNYASCHDNNTLFDRIVIATNSASRADQIKMNNLAAAIYLTAEGIPFMQAGEEMLRTKPGPNGTVDHNSYASPDSVNSIKWSTLDTEEYQNVYEYYKGLIAFRKAHGALRLTSAADVTAKVHSVSGLPANVVAFQIDGAGVAGETANSLYVIFNPNNAAQEITLPAGEWYVYVNGEQAGTEVLDTISGTATVAPISAMVLTSESVVTPPAPPAPVTPSTPGTTTPSVTTETTGQGDESVTETIATPSATTNGDTATSTVSASMGDEIVKQAVANESETVVIAPEIEGDVSKTEVTIPASVVEEIGSKTDADLTVSTPAGDVTIPNQALEELGSDGDSVTVSVETADDAVIVDIAVDGESVVEVPGGIKVAVPIEDGQVAVIVDADGNETIVRKSLVEDGVAYMILDGSATVKVVDNEKKYKDVDDTQSFSGAVDFVSSHELFRGTGKNTFSPNATMSRAMMATVLWRLEGESKPEGTADFKDVAGKTWYTKSVAWASENGIIQGVGKGKFAPDKDVTREEMAVMLYRYAANVGLDTTKRADLSTFTDGTAVHSWAREAVEWAVAVGLLQSNGNTINATGSASRAEVAVIFERLVKLQVK